MSIFTALSSSSIILKFFFHSLIFTSYHWRQSVSKICHVQIKILVLKLWRSPAVNLSSGLRHRQRAAEARKSSHRQYDTELAASGLRSLGRNRSRDFASETTEFDPLKITEITAYTKVASPSGSTVSPFHRLTDGQTVSAAPLIFCDTMRR